MQRSNQVQHVYEIEVIGPVGDCFSDLFPELVEHGRPAGRTVLRGPIVDGARLASIVDRLVTLNIALVRIERIESSGGRSG